MAKKQAAEAVSETNSAAVAANRTFLSVNGKSLDKTEGDIKFVSASRLNKEGITNQVVAEGIYEGSKVVEGGQFGPKTEYKITLDGTTTIIGEAGNLKSQMSKVSTGSYVQITYIGKAPMQSGPRKGKLSHRFLVGVATDE